MPEQTDFSDSDTHKILVMDDEHHVRDILRKVLEKFGYSAELTHDGESAVDCYKSFLETKTPVSLVILDLSVPGGMGGKEAAQEILAMDASAKIIISSGNPNDPMLRDYKDCGILDILPKPFRLDHLRSKVEQILAQ